MKDYQEPLLRKKPTNVILHVGTNDSVNHDAGTIINDLLDLKQSIEKELPNCTVVISLPMLSADNKKAYHTLNAVKKKLKCLEVNTMDNDNIVRDHLGRMGLHLNAKGNAIFVSSAFNKDNSKVARVHAKIPETVKLHGVATASHRHL